MIRRSITLEDGLNTFINQMRGKLMMDRGVDMDFTTAVNMLASLGMMRLSSNVPLDQKELDLANKFISGDTELKVDAATDEWWTRWLSIELPKLSQENAELKAKIEKADLDAKAATSSKIEKIPKNRKTKASS